MDLIDSREVARILGISVPTVNRRALSGQLPVAQRTPGRRGVRLFDREQIERMAAPDETRAAS